MIREMIEWMGGAREINNGMCLILWIVFWINCLLGWAYLIGWVIK